MDVRVKEQTLEEIKEKVATLSTPLNKISYLESALKDSNFTLEIKRYLYEEISKLYESRKMYERAARAMSNKAAIEVLFKERIDSYLNAAELFAKAGKVENADQMFVAASREANEEQKSAIKLARKNIYTTLAYDLEKQGKRATASKFYEKLIRLNISAEEKERIKQKLKKTYIALGQFREAKLLEGL